MHAVLSRLRDSGRSAKIRAWLASGVDPKALIFFTIGLVNWAAAPQLRRRVLGDGYSPAKLKRAVVAAARAISG